MHSPPEFGQFWTVEFVHWKLVYSAVAFDAPRSKIEMTDATPGAILTGAVFAAVTVQTSKQKY
jgi:hypothetical protein